MVDHFLCDYLVSLARLLGNDSSVHLSFARFVGFNLSLDMQMIRPLHCELHDLIASLPTSPPTFSFCALIFPPSDHEEAELLQGKSSSFVSLTQKQSGLLGLFPTIGCNEVLMTAF